MYISYNVTNSDHLLLYKSCEHVIIWNFLIFYAIFLIGYYLLIVPENASGKQKLKITRREIFSVFKTHLLSKNLNELLLIIENNPLYQQGNIYTFPKTIKIKIKTILMKMKSKWHKSHTIGSKFFEKK